MPTWAFEICSYYFQLIPPIVVIQNELKMNRIDHFIHRCTVCSLWTCSADQVELIFSPKLTYHLSPFKTICSLAMIKHRLIMQHSSHRSPTNPPFVSLFLSQRVASTPHAHKPNQFMSKLGCDVDVVNRETDSVLDPQFVKHIDFKTNTGPPPQIFSAVNEKDKCKDTPSAVQNYTQKHNDNLLFVEKTRIPHRQTQGKEHTHALILCIPRLTCDKGALRDLLLLMFGLGSW